MNPNLSKEIDLALRDYLDVSQWDAYIEKDLKDISCRLSKKFNTGSVAIYNELERRFRVYNYLWEIEFD